MHARLLLGAVLLPLAACAPTMSQQASDAGRSVRQTQGLAVALPGRSQSPAGELAAGTKISVVLKDTVTDARYNPGDAVNAILTKDVKDAAGFVIFPAGTEAQLRIAAFQQAMPHRDDARVLLDIMSVTVKGETFYLKSLVTASIKAPVKGGTTIAFGVLQTVPVTAS